MGLRFKNAELPLTTPSSPSLSLACTFRQTVFTDFWGLKLLAILFFLCGSHYFGSLSHLPFSFPFLCGTRVFCLRGHFPLHFGFSLFSSLLSFAFYCTLFFCCLD